ncbi:MAG: FG-GAP repeat domain-containing protein, partial [Vicinamibacterales bacterium]
MIRSALPVSMMLVAAACGGTAPASIQQVTGDPPWFEESAAARGLVFTHHSGHHDRFLLPEVMGGGAALSDMDGDGDLDAYLVQSGDVQNPANKGSGNRLFRNRGDGFFEDVTADSGADVPGYGMGVAAGDYDNDGDNDLYITNLGSNVLLQNDGRGRFRDVTTTAGVTGGGWSTSAAFLDFDGDGWLDLFVTRYLDWSPESERDCYSLTGVRDYCAPRNYDAPTSDLLFHNRGNGTFADVSAQAGLQSAVGNGLGIVATDFNADGRMDVFVANDGTPNHLWTNQGGVRFRDTALLAGVAIDQDGAPKAGMG